MKLAPVLWLLLVSSLSGACSQFIPLGVSPSEHPDRTPPIEARVHLDRSVVVDDGEGRRLPRIIGPGKVEGTVLRWNDEGLRFQLKDCSIGPGCVVDLSADALIDVEAREDASAGKWVALSASVAATLAVGTLFFIYVWNPVDGSWPQR